VSYDQLLFTHLEHKDRSDLATGGFPIHFSRSSSLPIMLAGLWREGLGFLFHLPRRDIEMHITAMPSAFKLLEK
jgi:hypothetical protein